MCDSYTSYHTDEFVKKNPLKLEIYPFSPDPELLRKAQEKYQAQLEERKRKFDALSEKLRVNRSTL